MPNLKQVLTDSYSKAIREHFDNNISSGMEKISVEKQEAELYRQLDQYQTQKEEVVLKWANTPIDVLNGLTPSDLINDMEEFKDVFELFMYMVEHADEEIPFIIVEKLKSYKDMAVTALVDLANSGLKNGNNDIFFIAAVSALGEFKITDSVWSLIDLAYNMNEKSYDLDHIEEALKNAGACTIEPILETLGEKEMGNVEKMLLYVLASAGSNFKDDRIYKKLRLAFRTMDDKMSAVICLNVYGDGRAIPMLRGYLERNNNIDRALFYEIVGTIQNLGGRTEEFIRSFR